VFICWGRGEPQIGWSVCVAVVGASCWRLGAVEEGTPLLKGRSTRRSPALVGWRCLWLPDGLAHPSRSAWAPGAGADVEVRPARRKHLWPCPVCEPSWPQSWQYRSCMAASCVGSEGTACHLSTSTVLVERVGIPQGCCRTCRVCCPPGKAVGGRVDHRNVCDHKAFVWQHHHHVAVLQGRSPCACPNAAPLGSTAVATLARCAMRRQAPRSKVWPIGTPFMRAIQTMTRTMSCPQGGLGGCLPF
jgi:hypothetical protein